MFHVIKGEQVATDYLVKKVRSGSGITIPDPEKKSSGSDRVRTHITSTLTLVTSENDSPS
jgi:hypothetical protein